MSLRKIGWLLAISICTLSVNANEDGKVYRVEILVFQNLDKSQMDGESWSGNPGYPRFEKAIKLLPLIVDEAESEKDSAEQNDLVFVSPDIMDTVFPQNENTEAVNAAPSYWVPYQSLSEDELYLKPFRDRLLKSEEYFPMRLSGWVQSIESREQARAVYLGDKPRGNESDNDDVVDETTAIEESNPVSVPEDNTGLFGVQSTLFVDTETLLERTGTENLIEEASVMRMPLPEPMSDPDVQEEQPSVEGIVRVSKATYFHVDVDMALNLPVQDTAEEVPYYLDDNWRAVFRLFESRRIKLEQINYFDHPAFGALVYVSEIKPPEDDDVIPSDPPVSISLLPTE